MSSSVLDRKMNHGTHSIAFTGAPALHQDTLLPARCSKSALLVRTRIHAPLLSLCCLVLLLLQDCFAKATCCDWAP